MATRSFRLVTAVAIVAGSYGVAAAQESEPVAGPAAANATRLFLGPTARSLPRGQAYLGVYEVVLPFVQVGVTDRISIGGGTPLLFGLQNGHPFWITPKVQVVNTGTTQVAVGALHAFGPSFQSAGVAYGVLTTGNDKTSLTAGAGVGYGLDGLHTTVVMVGGERRLNHRIRIMTENYISNGRAGILTGGIRFATSRFAGDLGLWTPFGDTTANGVYPMIAAAFFF
jgi:hypothetical protein